MPWCDTGAVSLHYEVAGDGPHSLALLHEMGGTVESWRAVLPLLDPRFRTLRLDSRGAGLSETVRTPYGVAEQADDLARVLLAAGLAPPWRLVGSAAGAAVALAFAAAHPGDVAGLVLCAPAVGLLAASAEVMRDRATLARREGMRAVVEATLTRSYPAAATPDPAVRDAYRARFLALDPHCYALMIDALLGAELDDALASVRCPCTVLAGRHDGARPPDVVEALARRVPGASFEVLDTGHLMPVQHPAMVASRINATLPG